MIQLDYTNYSKVYVIGDIHGLFERLKETITPNITNAVIIIAGDIGLGFQKKTYYNRIFKDLNKRLLELDSHILMFRGNHDDPSYFNGKKQIVLSNIRTIEDYTVVSTANHNTLCVGGSLSIDRMYRTPNKSYWKNEAMVYDEYQLNEIHENGIEIDSVVTHTYPRVPNIEANEDILKNWMMIDDGLEYDLAEEDATMTKLQEKLESWYKIKIWICGHLHISKVFLYKETIYQQADCYFSVYDMDNLYYNKIIQTNNN